MGLMDRFTKKKTAERLEQTGAVQATPVAATVAADKIIDGNGQAPTKSVAKKTKVAAVTSFDKSKPTGSLSYRVIIRPMVTEKASGMTSQGKYIFMVARAAKKDQVRRAVHELYGVKPIKVRVINVLGRPIRFGRGYGKRSDFKKAIVTLPKGQSITVHEGV